MPTRPVTRRRVAEPSARRPATHGSATTAVARRPAGRGRRPGPQCTQGRPRTTPPRTLRLSCLAFFFKRVRMARHIVSCACAYVASCCSTRRRASVSSRCPNVHSRCMHALGSGAGAPGDICMNCSNSRPNNGMTCPDAPSSSDSELSAVGTRLRGAIAWEGLVSVDV